MQPSQCPNCKHYRILRSCKAFPKVDSIPDEIWFGQFDHSEPFEGDNGVRFEPIDGYDIVSQKEEDEDADFVDGSEDGEDS